MTPPEKIEAATTRAIALMPYDKAKVIAALAPKTPEHVYSADEIRLNVLSAMPEDKRDPKVAFAFVSSLMAVANGLLSHPELQNEGVVTAVAGPLKAEINYAHFPETHEDLTEIIADLSGQISDDVRVSLSKIVDGGGPVMVDQPNITKRFDLQEAINGLGAVTAQAFPTGMQGVFKFAFQRAGSDKTLGVHLAMTYGPEPVVPANVVLN